MSTEGKVMDMSDPHENDPAEDPERHIGQEVPDPWATEPKPDIAWRSGAVEDPRDVWPGY
jgi:hypothetical protein